MITRLVLFIYIYGMGNIMRNTLLVIFAASALLLAGCGTKQICDNECLKLTQEFELRMKELEVQKISEQAKVEANKPKEVQVAEIQKQQALQETSVGEAVLWVGLVAATILPLFLC